MDMYNLINNYSAFLEKKFGEKVHKITIDAGFTCPNRDGTLGYGGCSYCNNEKFYHGNKSNIDSIVEDVTNKISSFKTRNKKINKFMLYFQAYSNTYAEINYLYELYNVVSNIEGVVGISIGTRSDCVDSDKLNMIADLSKKIYVCVEYGLESIYDDTLVRVNRGHDIKSFIEGVKETKKRNIDVCAHLIFGFPWENNQVGNQSAKFINELDIDFVKIHQLQVVKNTVMYNEFKNKPFHLLDLNEYTTLVCDFVTHLDKKIVIQRMSGDCPKELIGAAGFNESSSQFREHFFRHLMQNNLFQGCLV